MFKQILEKAKQQKLFVITNGLLIALIIVTLISVLKLGSINRRLDNDEAVIQQFVGGQLPLFKQTDGKVVPIWSMVFEKLGITNTASSSNEQPAFQ